MSTPVQLTSLFLLLFLVGATGGPVWPIPGGLWKPSPGVTPRSGNFVYLNSEPGDYVGGGQNYTYTPLNAQLSFSQMSGLLQVSVQGKEDWTGDFAAMSSLIEVEPGYYAGLEQYPFNNASVGGLSWYGDGRGCNTLTGWFAVDNATYQQGNLTFISLRFEQYCEGGTSALRGALRWSIKDHRKPHGPSKPPRGLWTPPKQVLSADNFAYLESQPGDYVGGGQNYSYNSSNALISVSSNASLIFVSINGNQRWSGDFQGMYGLVQLEVGYYGQLQRYPFNNPVLGGIYWSGNGCACDTVLGWFMVDTIVYNVTGLVELKLRFGQQCEEATPTLFGAIYWKADSPVHPPRPVPPPSNLWTPPEQVLSADNFVYLESQPGDYVGGGQNYSYNSSNALISVSSNASLISVSINGNQQWSGDFEGMYGMMQLEVGYYGQLHSYPYNNPFLGGIYWSGNGCGCDTLSSWFMVDTIVYNATGLVELKLRFGQQCEEATPTLFGAIYWKADSPVHPPRPVPPPSNLWTPPQQVISADNFVYLESQPGDYVGGGQNYSYNSSNALISVSSNASLISVSINGNQRWSGDFLGMYGMVQLEVGYYGQLQRYPFNNPVLGGISWSGNGGFCDTVLGWFMVDTIVYNATGLVELKLRFGQQCEEATPTLFGAIYWKADSPDDPPRPVPPPRGLWTPPEQVLSADNFVYLESQPGDYVGGGQNYSYNSSNALISVSSNASLISVSINGNQQWSGDFEGMYGMVQLEVGYYGQLQSYPFNNPVLGGISWSGNGCFCNTVLGWFMVDTIVYNVTGLVELKLRFGQQCEEATPTLFGAIYWKADSPVHPPRPVPPPSNLWTPPQQVISADNFVYLESQPGDYVGGGQNYSYNSSNALISVSSNASLISVSINGNQQWSGDFLGMYGMVQLEVGYYGQLQRYPFNNPVLGGISWSGNGGFCDTVLGWFMVDTIVYNATGLVELKLRFGQQCEEATPTLFGAIYWKADSPVHPPRPVPPPSNLWTPPQQVISADNFVYLESQPGDYVGGGQNYSYNSSNALISVSSNASLISISINGNQQWSGDFKGMYGMVQLEVGYYGQLRNYPFNNPVLGGISWSGNGRGCNSLLGWFMVDTIVYNATVLVELKLRFGQQCEEVTPTLFGAIYWRADSPDHPPRPVPPPGGLWTPPTQVLSADNFVYLESQPGDCVGGGQNYSYNSSNALISVSSNANLISVSINGNQRWSGDFKGMYGMAQLEVGYYGQLQIYPFNNPVLGGIYWSGNGSGCNTLLGWFMVDTIVYNATGLVELKLRFGQQCEEATPTLFGAISWKADSPDDPPRPVPPPGGLWTPPTQVLSADNFVYLESQPGDCVGGGQNYSYNSSNALISVSSNANLISVSINGNQQWSGHLKGMYGMVQLEVGYYGQLQLYPFNNPVLGGISWSGYVCFCNTLLGWFMVDAIAYNATGLVELKLRFGQQCEGTTSTLFGAIYWRADSPDPPPRPVPPPGGLWTPPTQVLSADNFVYLESQPGDCVGVGQNYSYNSSNALISVSSNANLIFVSINGNQQWSGDFKGMYGMVQLEVGYYGQLQSSPFNNPVLGGISWSGNGCSCNTLLGWFMVDAIAYNATGLVELKLRFGQQCEGTTSTLFGAIYWRADSPDPSPRPVPPPGGLWTPPKQVLSADNFVYLESQPGDYVGGGQNYSYNSSNALISVSSNANLISVSINGNQQWSGDFEGMYGMVQLEVGYYGQLQSYPFNNPVLGGLSWSGNGGGCNTLLGWFMVDTIVYNATGLVELKLRFGQQCEEATPTLFGAISWKADSPDPPRPVPPPRGLWTPPKQVLSVDNFVYLESQPGDYVGGGQNYSYNSSNALISVGSNANLISVSINGNQQWSGDLKGMYGMVQLEVGYYGQLQSYPFNNPVLGGISWSGNGCSCNTLLGWFMVDTIVYNATGLVELKLRFGQQCEEATPTLFGAIYWKADSPDDPPRPVPPPRGLWTPPKQVLSVDNFVYLESQPGDYVGGGQNYSYNSSNALISVGSNANLISVSINGNQQWSGDLKGMYGMVQLEVGYYGQLQSYPFNNPVLGGISWSGNGCSCNTLLGWFMVDTIVYNATGLVELKLRFGQQCEEATPTLFGAIYWKADSPDDPPRPVPPPKGLWTPPKQVLSADNFAYLESQPGDFVGGGQNYSYNSSNALISVSSNANLISVSINGNQQWSGDFKGMYGMVQLEEGYYGQLQRYPFNNPVLGGLSWSGNGGGCNTLLGWFMVDTIVYNATGLVELKLRFGQQCEEATPTLFGAISWKADSPDDPPRPVPPPSGLWKPAPDAVPSSGNYVYLESQPGDVVGEGLNYTYTPSNASLDVSSSYNLISVQVNGNNGDWWYGDFEGMYGMVQLEVGYYGQLQRYPFNNPVLGGLSWYGGGGCNTLSGWFVVDAIQYSGVALSQVSLRFGQYCDEASAALNGAISWQAPISLSWV